MIDGKPIDNSQYTFDPLNPAQNRDPRFNNTVIYDGALVPADVLTVLPQLLTHGLA